MLVHLCNQIVLIGVILGNSLIVLLLSVLAICRLWRLRLMVIIPLRLLLLLTLGHVAVTPWVVQSGIVVSRLGLWGLICTCGIGRLGRGVGLSTCGILWRGAHMTVWMAIKAVEADNHLDSCIWCERAKKDLVSVSISHIHTVPEVCLCMDN